MDSIVKRVEKLLKLANSDNMHEASLALNTANKLMKQYSIETHQLNKKEYDIDSQVYQLPHSGVPWTRCLASRIVKLFSGQHIYSKNFIHHEGHQSLRFFVERHNVTPTKLMLDYAFETVNRLFKKEYNKSHGKWDLGYARKYFHSFRHGIVHEMCKTLDMINADNSNEAEKKTEYGLILYDSYKKAGEVMTSEYPQTTTMYSRTGSSNSSGYNKGASSGKNIRFNKQAGAGNSQPILISA